MCIRDRLKTSVEEPERIKDIGYVLKMVTDKDIIPDEFRELYETFCNTLKKMCIRDRGGVAHV